jgi:hypothetical protein
MKNLTKKIPSFKLKLKKITDIYHIRRLYLKINIIKKNYRYIQWLIIKWYLELNHMFDMKENYFLYL